MLKSAQKVSFIIILVSLTIGFAYYLSRHARLFTPIGKRATGSLSVVSTDLATNSQVRQDKEITTFFLSQHDQSEGLFQTTIASSTDALSFTSAKPVYEGNLNVLTPQAQENQILIPKTPFELTLVSENTDTTQKKHYYFTQTQCGKVPVFSSYISLHTTQEGHIYAVDGNMVKSGVTCDRVFTPSQVIEAARKQAQTEPEFRTIKTSEVVAEYIFNPYLVGISKSSGNHLVHIVNICSASAFCRSYFVSQRTGEVVFSHDLSSEAMSREVVAGATKRSEGQAPVSSATVNKGYDILGETYTYYMNMHQRDSFDGRGGRMRMNISCSTTQAAMWDGSQIHVCDGFVTNDVISHEFAHGVTQYAVGGSQGLIYENESGGLNESLSDIFGSEIDSQDWTMGEDSSMGAIRDLATPPRFRQPDSLYSPLYLCSGSQKVIVHTNSGVFNKAYYLMVQGGTHNSCTVTGVGRQKASAVIYKALTTYLRGKSSANSRDMYNAVTQACADLYGGATSTECQNITAALQSTHMDKQPLGKTLGVACGVTRPTGTSLPAATCAGATGISPTGEQTPTPQQTPLPTELTPTPSKKMYDGLIFSLSPGEKIIGEFTSNFDGELFTLESTVASDRLRMNDYTYKAELIGPGKEQKVGEYQKKSEREMELRFSGAQDLTSYFNLRVIRVDNKSKESVPVYIGRVITSSDEPKDVVVGLSLRFQGINRKAEWIEGLSVRVGVTNEELDKPIFTEIAMNNTADGSWTGFAVFDKSILEQAEKPSNFALLIKGMRHSQKKICDTKPTESEDGVYECDTPSITLKSGYNELDFTGITLLSGDTQPQDGVVNSLDISRIRNNLGSKDPDILRMMDLNSDGIINAVDDSLIISSLKVRIDER